MSILQSTWLLDMFSKKRNLPKGILVRNREFIIITVHDIDELEMPFPVYIKKANKFWKNSLMQLQTNIKIHSLYKWARIFPHSKWA